MTDRGGHRERIAAALAGDTWVRVQYPIRIRELELLRSAAVTPRTLRLTLGGPQLQGFESHVPVEHVRFVLPDPGGRRRLPEPDGDVLAWPRPFPPSREYTVRRYAADVGELDVDVVLHGGGLVSDWAAAARPGDRVAVAGPPGGVVIPTTFGSYRLAADETALPAVARWLERASASTRGHAVIEVADAAERQSLVAPPGVTVTWLTRDGGPSRLADAVRAVAPDARPFVWAAGEAGAVRPIRRWAREDLGLAPGAVSVSGYWKRGVENYDDHD